MKAKECFNAGLLAGRLQSAMAIARDDSRTQTLREEVKTALTKLGLAVNERDLASIEKLTRQVREICSEMESACFDLGLDFLPLQTHLKMMSVGAPSSIETNAALTTQIAGALKALIEQMRLNLARIGASEIADPFLRHIGSTLANPDEMIRTAGDIFAETEILKVRIEAWLSEPSQKRQTELYQKGLTPRIFLVHGHDHGRKEAVARLLEKLGLEPIILHEKPDAGRTIIEKFSDYSDVQFAVVLLTADDEGRSRREPNQTKPRARQNVILELGYFLGKLGRKNVCVLYESGVEIPSDYAGVLFISLDSSDMWRMKLGRELKAAGLDVDMNAILDGG